MRRGGGGEYMWQGKKWREAAEESNQKRMQREHANVGESIQQNEGD